MRTPGFWAQSAVNQRVQMLEMTVFLSLIIPSMAVSFLPLRQAGVSFVLEAVLIIMRDLALVSLIAFFLWRNRESMVAIGWAVRRTGKEIALGALLFLPLLMALSTIERGLSLLGFARPSPPPSSLRPTASLGETLVALVLVTVVAIAEEVIFRGYLLLRLHALLRKTWLAVVASTALFSLGHGYEGPAGVVMVGLLGLAFAIVVVWRGNLVAAVTMHFLQDSAALVLLPFIGAGR